MQSAKEKVMNMASAAKDKIHLTKSKAEEKKEKATARAPEERTIAEEMEKVKEAEAMADLHAAKARHAAEQLEAKQHNSGLSTDSSYGLTHDTRGPLGTGHRHEPGLHGTTTTTGTHGILGTGTGAGHHRHPDPYGTTATTHEPTLGGAAGVPGTTPTSGDGDYTYGGYPTTTSTTTTHNKFM